MTQETESPETVIEFFTSLPKSVDGLVAIITSIAAVLLTLLSFTGLTLFGEKSGKQLTILAFTPAIIFLLLIIFRQLPFGGNCTTRLLSSAALIFAFAALNFK